MKQIYTHPPYLNVISLYGWLNMFCFWAVTVPIKWTSKIGYTLPFMYWIQLSKFTRVLSKLGRYFCKIIKAKTPIVSIWRRYANSYRALNVFTQYSIKLLGVIKHVKFICPIVICNLNHMSDFKLTCQLLDLHVKFKVNVAYFTFTCLIQS